MGRGGVKKWLFGEGVGYFRGGGTLNPYICNTGRSTSTHSKYLQYYVIILIVEKRQEVV